MRLSSVARNFILAATAMSAIASANAQFDFNYNDFEDQFDRDFRNGHHQRGQEMRIAERVGQTFGPGFSDLRVARLLKLRQYTGYELKKIILVAETQPQFGGHRNGPIRDRRDLGRPGMGRGHGRHMVAEATLLIDGAPQGYPKMISRFKDRIELDVTDRNAEIGHDLSRVKIELRGSVHVYRVAAIIEKTRGHHGRTETVREQVGQYFSQYNTLKVRQALRLNQQHNGKNIVEVSVRAQDMSRRGRAQAQLLVNGVPEGMPQSVDYGQVTFRLQRGLTLGDEIRSLQVQFTKEVYVESVSAVLTKGRGGHGPGPRPTPGRRILDESLYLRVAGDKVVDLAQAMQATRSEANKQIRTVELVINNSGMRGQIRLCKGQVVRGRPGQGSAQCTDTQRLSFGRQTITLNGDQFLSLDQATIAARGDMIIESARVVLQ
ncbi:MAG: hypothetical protein GY909_09170 [Oligoflexia bacterium]|nr:hypothetical protein [Oligoflexia bacterium]